MQHDRDKPCSPKTYARRVTAIKNFFGYLHSNEILRRDPSNAVIQRTVNTGLPDILTDDEVAGAMTACQAMRMGMFGQKPDARPLLLVMLLLDTGIKKSETVGLHLKDVERDNPEETRIWVRYINPKQRFKERRIPIRADWLPILDEYIKQRKTTDVIFDNTARMLEYVLRDVAKLADIESSKMSFETLRWTCAFHDYREGMEPDDLRQKLGISRITWSKTGEKLAQLMRGYRDDETTADDD
jgi:integrase/recombinase XerD